MAINPRILFTKVRDVKSPNRANAHDAGTDFFVPNCTFSFYQDLVEKNEKNTLKYTFNEDNTVLTITIPAGEQVMIPSGIKVWILDKNTYLQATNKSGIASKFHLDVMANVIDADYQGEMHLNVVNTGNTSIEITTGQKLVQMIHKEFINTQWEEISNEEYDKIEISDRGEGGFGSSKIY